MAPLPSLEDFARARERLEGVARRTPLLPLHPHHGAREVFIKLETLQPIGSFKIRGVFNAVAALDEEARARGVSTVSAGNTAQALAFAAKRFGVPARSLMPETAPRTKVEAVRAWGGEPVLVPTSEVFRFLKERGWEREPYAFIHPWTNRDVMTGHGSLGLEIAEDLADVETVLVPVGGGGLLAGVGSALRAVKPDVRMLAVEPEGCPAFHESLRLGRPAQVECRTIADGVAVPYITDAMFPLLRELSPECVLVSEDAIRAAVLSLALLDKLVVEPSGALGVAAALALPAAERRRRAEAIRAHVLEHDLEHWLSDQLADLDRVSAAPS